MVLILIRSDQFESNEIICTHDQYLAHDLTPPLSNSMFTIAELSINTGTYSQLCCVEGENVRVQYILIFY